MNAAPRIAIVGAGVGGLATAYYLQQQLPGALVWLVDASDRPGGKVRTLRTPDFYVELGPDSLLATKPAGLELVQELGLSDKVVPPAPVPAYIYWSGRLHRLLPGLASGAPSNWRALASTRLLTPWGKLRALLDLVTPPTRNTADESVGRFFARRLGPEVRDRLADPLLAGLYSSDVNRLSLLGLFPQLRSLECQAGSLIRGLRKYSPGPGPGSPFRSLSGGLEVLVERLAQRVPGRHLMLGTPVKQVARAQSQWEVLTDHGKIEADAVVLAVPAPVAATLVRGSASDLASALQRQRLVSVAVAVFAWRGKPPAASSGFLVPSRAGPRICGATFFSVKWPGSAQPDWTVVRVFLGRAGDCDMWDWDDTHMTRVAWEEMTSIANVRAEPAFSYLHRWPDALPQYDVGHPDWLAQIETEAARFPGLFLTGASYRGIGLPDLVRQANDTASRVAQHLGALERPPARSNTQTASG